MNYISHVNILASNEIIQDKSLVCDKATIYEGQTLKVIIPESPLALGSVKIMLHSGAANFSQWHDLNKLEVYNLIRQVIRLWENKGIKDYLIYGKESNDSNSIFSWEIVPYPKDGWRFWKQFKVLWNITFGSSRLSLEERHAIAKDFQKDIDLFSKPLTKQIENIKKIALENDAFCNPQVIDKQLVFAGKEINVLYNYAPIAMGTEKLHFLIVPKQHREKFSDLTESEYLESMCLVQKLISFYKEKGYHTAYLFDKTGAEAGQTVSHWHQHVIFTATKTEEFFGKIVVLKNMILGYSTLSQHELQKRVQTLAKELAEVSKT